MKTMTQTAFTVFAFGIAALILACSAPKEAEPPAPPPVPTTKDGRHFLADKPLKLMPKRKQKMLLLQEEIEAAEERAKAYKHVYGTPGAAMPLIPKTVGAKEISLQQAVEGISGDGPLQANIETSAGNIVCNLWEKKAPKGVAHFVSLARGINRWWNRRVRTWSDKPFYNATPIYKIKQGQLFYGGYPPQAGDSAVISPTVIDADPEAKPPKLEPYTLALLGGHSQQPLHTNFVLTAADAPPLDTYAYPIGTCKPYDIIQKISGTKTTTEGIPLREIKLNRILISR